MLTGIAANNSKIEPFKIRREAYSIASDTFAHTSPYRGCWLEHFYNFSSRNIFGSKVSRESDFLAKIEQTKELPELMIVGNFAPDRSAIISLCHEWGINTVHGEDGFFPHYSTMHADPLGFCWESSLSRMIHRQCNEVQKMRARNARKEWLTFDSVPLPETIRRPFVFWPLQLIGDQVNKWDLKVKDWVGLLKHFRACLPIEYQLLIKEHPRSKPHDNTGINELVAELANTIIVSKNTSLKTLLNQCCAVAGANSTVLSEARLMFHKPVYAYARGWYTNHVELFMPVAIEARQLNRLDWLEDNNKLKTERLDDYTDWFLAQLLARQISHAEAISDPIWFKKRVYNLSRASFIKYGEEIFLDALKS